MEPQEAQKILLVQDIFPLGDYEAIPVTHQGSGQAQDYPNVLALKEIPKHALLAKEALEHIEKIGQCYIEERSSHIDPRIPACELKEILLEMGFVKGQYQIFSLRKLGTNQLQDFIGSVTREFFAELSVNVFRQQYALAKDGWKTIAHRDHGDFNVHGYRGMLPLTTPAYLGYVGPAGENLIYRLEVGTLYFVNAAQLHRGFSFGEDRLNLMFQMDSDKLLFGSNTTVCRPLDDLSPIPPAFVEFGLS
jgi:hypothetical protein